GRERAVEWLRGEVDRHELDAASRQVQPARSAATVGLAGRVVDGEHLGVLQSAQTPGPAVQTSADDDELAVAALSHGVVDEDRAGHHPLGAGPQTLPGEPFPQ